MAAPGTGWAERFEPGEPARHAEAARALVAMQQAKSKRFGTGRALHRKPIVALKGTLRVLDGVPAQLRHGLFERLGGYDVTLRLSNGGTDVANDRVPDIRGFSLRVHGLHGPGALGGTTDHQDFTLINRSAFAFPDSRPFVGLVLAASQGPAGLIGWALRTYGPLKMFGQLKRLKDSFDLPFSGTITRPDDWHLHLRDGAALARGAAAHARASSPRAHRDAEPEAAGDDRGAGAGLPRAHPRRVPPRASTSSR
jgi:hypothetical protein